MNASVTPRRLSGEPTKAGTFSVASASMPGESWVVIYVNETERVCFCLGFHHRRDCRHVQAVAALIKVEAAELLAAATEETRADAQARLIEIERIFAR